MRGNRQKAQTPREAESEGITDPKQTKYLWGSLSSSLGVQISFLSFTPCSHMDLALTPARSLIRSSKGLSSSVTSVTVSCQPLPPDPRLCRVSGRVGGRRVGEEEPEEWPLSPCASPHPRFFISAASFPHRFAEDSCAFLLNQQTWDFFFFFNA